MDLARYLPIRCRGAAAPTGARGEHEVGFHKLGQILALLLRFQTEPLQAADLPHLRVPIAHDLTHGAFLEQVPPARDLRIASQRVLEASEYALTGAQGKTKLLAQDGVA
jgi:hypothetical protein